MDMNPQRVRTAEFQTVKKGLDPSEVRSFLNAVADELERAQNQSTAMEARARAAVARLQELSDGAATQSEAASATRVPETSTVEAAGETTTSVTPTVDQSETISRTLLLAQRTADTTIADAESEAAAMRADAEAESSRTLDSTRAMAAQLLDEARSEARKVGEDERLEVETMVNSLAARRDFLESDVDHLEQFLVDQRSRLREAANELIELSERVPGGLGDVRRPLLSASDDEDDKPAAGSAAADTVGDTTDAASTGATDAAAADADASSADAADSNSSDLSALSGTAEPDTPNPVDSLDDEAYVHVSDEPDDTPMASSSVIDSGQDPLLSMKNDDGADLAPEWSDQRTGDNDSKYGFGDNN